MSKGCRGSGLERVGNFRGEDHSASLMARRDVGLKDEGSGARTGGVSSTDQELENGVVHRRLSGSPVNRKERRRGDDDVNTRDGSRTILWCLFLF